MKTLFLLVLVIASVYCSDAECEIMWPGSVDCSSDGSNDCRTLDTDYYHCGTCNNECGLSEECVQGTCTCVAPNLVCDGACVYNDEYNCGTCNNTCRESEYCVSGACSCENDLCPNTNVCVTQWDLSNCGGCGVQCNDGQECVSFNNTQYMCADYCRVYGDPHFKTVDSLDYDFYGDGDYTIAASSSFIVQGRFIMQFPWWDFSVAEAFVIKVTSSNTIVEFQCGFKAGLQPYVMVDGVQVTVPYTDPSFSILETGYGYYDMLIDNVAIAQINFAGNIGNLELYLPQNLALTNGLCGNHDGNPNNDIMFSNFSIVNWGDDWESFGQVIWDAQISQNATTSFFNMSYSPAYVRNLTSPPVPPVCEGSLYNTSQLICNETFAAATDGCMYLYDYCMFDVCMAGGLRAAAAPSAVILSKCERVANPQGNCPFQCNNYGYCVDISQNDTWTCECWDGYTGDYCTPTCINVNNCNAPNGTCIDIDYCQCNGAQYDATDCHALKTECESGCKFCEDPLSLEYPNGCVVCDESLGYHIDVYGAACTNVPCADGSDHTPENYHPREYLDTSVHDAQQCRVVTCDAGETFPNNTIVVNGCTRSDEWGNYCELACDTEAGYVAKSVKVTCSRTTPGPYPPITLACVKPGDNSVNGGSALVPLSLLFILALLA